MTGAQLSGARWRLKAAAAVGASVLTWAMAPAGVANAGEPKPPKPAPAPKTTADQTPPGQDNKQLAQDALKQAQGNASSIHRNSDQAKGRSAKPERPRCTPGTRLTRRRRPRPASCS